MPHKVQLRLVSRTNNCCYGNYLASIIEIRKHLKQVISTPLDRLGTSEFKVLESNQAGEDSDTRAVFTAIESDAKSFGTLQAVSRNSSVFEEVPVKFISADIQKNTGWKIEFADGKVLPVQMKDKYFVERLQTLDAPHLFGQTFNIRLETVTTMRLNNKSTSRLIVNVRNSV